MRPILFEIPVGRGLLLALAVFLMARTVVVAMRLRNDAPGRAYAWFLGGAALCAVLVGMGAANASLDSWGVPMFGFRIPVFAYGFDIMIGFVTAISLACVLAKRRGIDPNDVLDIGMICVVAGVAGARLFYYLENYTTQYATQPWWKVFAIWEGGIVYYGGLLLATLACVAYLRARRLSVLAVTDTLAPGLLLGLSFGRIGCFLNGCCWGRPLPEGSVLENALGVLGRFPRRVDAATGEVVGSPAFYQHSRPGELQHLGLTDPIVSQDCERSAAVHPTELYEWIGALALCALLVLALRRSRRAGTTVTLAFVTYAPLRFAIECLRGDNHPKWGTPFTVSQIVSLVLIAPACALLAYLWTRAPAQRQG